MIHKKGISLIVLIITIIVRYDKWNKMDKINKFLAKGDYINRLYKIGVINGI